MGKEIKLGDVARDSITGYEGVVFGLTEWLYQCRRFGLQAKELTKEGKPHDIQWFDELQCELVSSGQPIQIAEPDETGGPAPAPTRNADPGVRG